MFWRILWFTVSSDQLFAQLLNQIQWPSFWLFARLVTITPFLLIPIWVIPNPYSPLIRNFLWMSMLMTILMMTLAALTGNIYWYYDNKRHKWSWFYHCGKGPKDHYWCATLFHNHKPSKSSAKSRPNHISLNVWQHYIVTESVGHWPDSHLLCIRDKRKAFNGLYRFWRESNVSYNVLQSSVIPKDMTKEWHR